MREENKKSYLQGIFGTIYIQLSSSIDELASNYIKLLEEKSTLLKKINSFIYTSNPTSKITLESWELDLLQLQENPVPYNKEKSISYPLYYSLQEQTIIDTLKKAAYENEKISEENFKTLYDFIRNRGRVEKIIEESGNGLKLDAITLEKIMNLTNNRVVTAGKSISLYEELCNKLGLTKKEEKTLEYRIQV